MLDGRELLQRRNSSSGNYAKGRKSLSLEPFPGLSAGHRRWSAAVRVVPAVGFPQYEGFTTFESSPPVEKSPPSGFAPRVVPAFREVSAGGVRRSSRSRSRISEVRGFLPPRVVPAVRVRRSRGLPSFDPPSQSSARPCSSQSNAAETSPRVRACAPGCQESVTSAPKTRSRSASRSG